jgi:hypothetical protein
MNLRIAVLAPIAMVLSACAQASPSVAHADTTDDDTFWAAVQSFDFGSKVTRNAAISMAKTMCGGFRGGYETPAERAASLADWANVSEYKAGEFVGAAITTYCPEQMPPSAALQASGASTEPASYVELGRGRMNLIVPDETYQTLGQDERTAWGLSIVQHPASGRDVAAADLAMVAETALNRVFRFLDRLCWVASFERVPNCADFMDMNIVAGLSMIGPENMVMIPRLLGLQSAAHDDETDAPYPLHPLVAAFYDRRRELRESMSQP